MLGGGSSAPRAGPGRVTEAPHDSKPVLECFLLLYRMPEANAENTCISHSLRLGRRRLRAASGEGPLAAVPSGECVGWQGRGAPDAGMPEKASVTKPLPPSPRSPVNPGTHELTPPVLGAALRSTSQRFHLPLPLTRLWGSLFAAHPSRGKHSSHSTSE